MEKEYQESELPEIARWVLAKGGSRRQFAFTGDIGAGKTTLIKEICAQLGVADTVTSPTFSIVNEYVYPKQDTGQLETIYHLDLYRLETLEEALDIGVENYLDTSAYCFIEWPALIEPLLPPDLVEINIVLLENSKRKILIL